MVHAKRLLGRDCRGNLVDHRVVREFCKLATVEAIGDALHRGITRSRVDQHQGRLVAGAQSAGVLPIDHCTPGKHRSVLVWHQYIAQFLPMQEIATNRMAPVHVAPTPAIGIMWKNM